MRMGETRRILFVCTGNICRSPMAESIARDLFGGADRAYESAGVMAVTGAPATATASVACREIGVDMAGHAARQFGPKLAEGVDRIVVMTAAHRDRVTQLAPDAAGRVVMLRSDGADVADPYGFDLDAYRATRDEIAAALREADGF
jgi:protein-tyrosine phosphatase